MAWLEYTINMYSNTKEISKYLQMFKSYSTRQKPEVESQNCNQRTSLSSTILQYKKVNAMDYKNNVSSIYLFLLFYSLLHLVFLVCYFYRSSGLCLESGFYHSLSVNSCTHIRIVEKLDRQSIWYAEQNTRPNRYAFRFFFQSFWTKSVFYSNDIP